MSTPNMKVCVPALALALVPISANAQDKVLPQNDTITNTIVLDQQSLPKDVFERSAADSTTLDITKFIKDESVDSTSSNSNIKTEIKKEVKDFIKDPNTQRSIGLEARYCGIIDDACVGVNADFKKNNTTIGGNVMLGHNDQKDILAGGVYGQYDFPLGGGFYTYPKLSINGAKVANNGDTSENLSMIAPQVDAGIKYVKQINNDLELSAALEGGGSVIIAKTPESSDYNKSYSCKGVDLDFLAKVGAKYKNVIVFVDGGKNPRQGYNVGGGVSWIF